MLEQAKAPLRAWMARVTELPCVWCPRPRAALHHLGICACDVEGRKAPHGTVILLSKFHYDEFHRTGMKPWEARVRRAGRSL
jgi:hypothetical protein